MQVYLTSSRKNKILVQAAAELLWLKKYEVVSGWHGLDANSDSSASRVQLLNKAEALLCFYPFDASSYADIRHWLGLDKPLLVLVTVEDASLPVSLTTYHQATLLHSFTHLLQYLSQIQYPMQEQLLLV